MVSGPETILGILLRKDSSIILDGDAIISFSAMTIFNTANNVTIVQLTKHLTTVKCTMDKYLNFFTSILVAAAKTPTNIGGRRLHV